MKMNFITKHVVLFSGVSMRKILLLIFIFMFFLTEAGAYSIKVYDQMGNRVGTYKKDGDNYVLYDFYDKKVDDPSTLIKNAPNQKTLKEYSQTFYDENMIPIFTYSTGLYGNDGMYYPRGFYPPRCWYNTSTPSIVRPANKSIIKSEKATNIIKTGF